MALVQGPASLLEQRHRVDPSVRTGAAESIGQERDHGTQRQQRGGPAAGHPFGRVAGRRGLLTALIGQPGLPDAGPAVDHHAREFARVHGPLEHLELQPAADDRPPRQCDRHTSQHVSPALGRQSPAVLIRRAVMPQAVTTAGLSPATIPTMRSAR